MNIRIVGAYLPRLDRSALLEAAEQQAQRFRRVNLDLIQQGFSGTVSEVEERTPEYADEITRYLERAVLFEAEVTDSTEQFDGRCFYSPVIDEYGCSPVLLSMDGCQLLTDDREETTYEQNFRVLFFMNDWHDDCTLDGPTGALQLSDLIQVPSRVWKFAEYTPLD
jgi:hypothetical protein